MHRRQTAATPDAFVETKVADITSERSMQRKKQRTAAKRPGRTTGDGQSSEAMAQADRPAKFDEREVTPRPEAEQAVRTRAYYLFLERGGRSGHELDDWLRAESEVRQ
jgi:hypothetical protein